MMEHVLYLRAFPSFSSRGRGSGLVGPEGLPVMLVVQ